VRSGGRAVVVGVAAVLVLGGGLVALATRDRPEGRGAPGSTAAAGGDPGCVPTRGEAAQGSGEVPADAPSSGRLGPGGELRRTAETLAAGRGGERLVVSGTVYGADCRTPLAGASLEVWQTNAAGEYGPGNDACCYLAAALRTDRLGRYRFETVKPGHYRGEARPPPAHIHVEVRHPDAAGLLTELLFAGDPYLGPDPHGAVVAPAPVPGADPPTLQARFDIVLRAA
jgi:hypothetical protein